MSRLWIFNIIQYILTVFQNFADVILSSAFLALYGLSTGFLKGSLSLIIATVTGFSYTLKVLDKILWVAS